MKTPFKYLGMPIGGSHKRRSFWEGVVESVRKRLGRWKNKFISMTGRLCLIKSMLSSLPLFYLSLYKIVVMVAKEVERLQRNFLCGWGSEGRKVAWVSWKKVCETKEMEGLGMLELRMFNVALIGKWIWRLSNDERGLWKEVMESKYGG